MANLATTLKESTAPDLSGKRSFQRRMFGNAGATTNADVGGWIKVDSYQWKGFQLQPVDQSLAGGAAIGASVAVIEGAFEIEDESNPFSNCQDPYLIATLNNTTRHAAIENPFRWVRARTTAIGAYPVQVGMVAIS